MSSKVFAAALTCTAFVLVGSSGVARGALAKKVAGGAAPVASYSATLSSNAVVRQQQLICDPPEPLRLGFAAEGRRRS